MAKTFKNLSRPAEQIAAKPASERDFFDLTEDPSFVDKLTEAPKTKRNTSNINNTGNTGDKSITSVTKHLEGGSTSTGAVPVASEGVRQTFVVGRSHLEQLRDYVHFRRSKGEYTYSQKQALQEALDLLFASGPAVPQRPEETRQLEQQQQERIKRGRGR